MKAEESTCKKVWKYLVCLIGEMVFSKALVWSGK